MLLCIQQYSSGPQPTESWDMAPGNSDSVLVFLPDGLSICGQDADTGTFSVYSMEMSLHDKGLFPARHHT